MKTSASFKLSVACRGAAHELMRFTKTRILQAAPSWTNPLTSPSSIALSVEQPASRDALVSSIQIGGCLHPVVLQTVAYRADSRLQLAFRPFVSTSRSPDDIHSRIDVQTSHAVWISDLVVPSFEKLPALKEASKVTFRIRKADIERSFRCTAPCSVACVQILSVIAKKEDGFAMLSLHI